MARWTLIQFIKNQSLLLRVFKSRRLVLSFEGAEKKLALNRINALGLQEKHGSDYKNWTKETITLAAVPVTFNGEQVKGLRIL